jgi:hypothetical protein
MSVISDKVNAFKNKLAGLLPDYNIVIAGENGCDGFVSPYIQLFPRWNPIEDGTANQAKKILIRITILIGKNYFESNDTGGVNTAEEIETNVESIMDLSIRIPSQEFAVINSMNNEDPAKETEFDIIL